MYILIIHLIYSSPKGDMVKIETLDSFQTERACLEFKVIEDKHLKRIKSKTNIKEWSMDCNKGF